MNTSIERYKGREQSYIKHQFLTQYLEAAAYKILQSRSTAFNFVDAFAGPWRISQEDYSDASFDQAIRTLEGVRISLDRPGVNGPKMRFCFCEQRPEAVSELREYANQKPNCEIHVLSGEFESNLREVAEICKDDFTFTFIDPTGWNIDNGPIFDFLKQRNGEFLFNFMADSINRHATYDRVSESFGRFLASLDWIEDFKREPACLSIEERVLRVLKRRIKKSGAATYVPDMPILNPRQNRIKMRLLLGTFNENGVSVFRDVQHKVEQLEIETRDKIRDDKLGFRSLFNEEEFAAIRQKEAGVGCPRYVEMAREKIKQKLSSRSTQYSELSTAILEDVPIKMPQLNRVMNEMKNAETIYYTLPPQKRVPQPETIIQLETRKTKQIKLFD